MANMQTPWVDGPFKLIETPAKTKDVSEHSSIFIANDMSNVHNLFIRGLNSIKLQGSHVHDEADIKDFLQYVSLWTDMLETHHKEEEEFFFPAVEKAMGNPGLMHGNEEQHHAFQPGLEHLGEWAKKTAPAQYSAAQLNEILDSFAPTLYQHMCDEINTLLAMRPYDSEKLMAAIHETLQHIYANIAGREALLFPFLLGHHDRTYEGGNDWPPPAPGSSVDNADISEQLSAAHPNLWRFLPSTVRGVPQPLKFVA